MPITGRTLEEASSRFRDHLNSVLARTVTQTPLILVKAVRPRGASPGIQFGRTPIFLNDVHLPTGFVTIEEILRFCIVDLGVEPLSDEWHEILQASYELFKGDFAPRGHLG